MIIVHFKHKANNNIMYHSVNNMTPCLGSDSKYLGSYRWAQTPPNDNSCWILVGQGCTELRMSPNSSILLCKYNTINAAY